jgi:hypothetical protein
VEPAVAADLFSRALSLSNRLSLAIFCSGLPASQLVTRYWRSTTSCRTSVYCEQTNVFNIQGECKVLTWFIF